MKNRIVHSIISILTAFVFLIDPVFAAEDPSTYPVASDGEKTTAPFVTKELIGNKGVSLTHTFTFTFTPAGTTTVDAGDHPAIADVTIDITKKDSETSAVSSADVTLPSQFSKPGVYAYKVAEKEDAGFNSQYETNGKIEFDQETYTMLIYVDSDLQITTVTAVKDSTKQKTSWDTGKGMKFENKIIKNANPDPGNPDPDNPSSDRTADVIIKKQVEGTYGDRNKAFNFTVTFSTDGTVALPKDWSLSSITGSTGSTKLTNKNGTFTFTLKHGQQAEFSNVPAGVTYTVKEDGAKGYTAVYKDAKITDAFTGTKGQGVTASGCLVHENGGANGQMTNTYENITPTGIVTKNASFLFMILAAAAAAIVSIRSKREQD